MGFAARGQIEVAEAVSDHALKELLMVPYLFPNGVRKRLPPRSKPDFHEILRIAHRQRPEHERIHETEDRGIRAYAERESGNDNERKAGAPAENPQCVADIPTEIVEPGQASLIAQRFHCLSNMAISKPCCTPCVFRRVAASFHISGSELEMCLNLFL
jgi:hypothetical protein